MSPRRRKIKRRRRIFKGTTRARAEIYRLLNRSIEKHWKDFEHTLFGGTYTQMMMPALTYDSIREMIEYVEKEKPLSQFENFNRLFYNFKYIPPQYPLWRNPGA